MNARRILSGLLVVGIVGLLLIAALPVFAYNTFVTEYAHCEEWGVFAFYVGGSETRRILVDVTITVDGVSERIQLDQTVTNEGYKLFSRRGVFPTSVVTTGYVRLYIPNPDGSLTLEDEDLLSVNWQDDCGRPTATPMNTPLPGETPLPDATPLATPGDPTMPAPPPLRRTDCVIENSAQWGIAPADLYVYGHNAIGWNDVERAYTVFWIDLDVFPVGSTIPVTFADQTPFVTLTLIAERRCVYTGDPATALLASAASTPCAEVCLTHQDEILQPDSSGAWSMQAVVYDPIEGQMLRVAVSSAPFALICGTGGAAAAQNAAGYYLWLGDPGCRADRDFVAYDPCVLTPDISHPYWWDVTTGNVLILPGQSLSEIVGALHAVSADPAAINAFAARWQNGGLYTGAGWYSLT